MCAVLEGRMGGNEVRARLLLGYVLVWAIEVRSEDEEYLSPAPPPPMRSCLSRGGNVLVVNVGACVGGCDKHEGGHACDGGFGGGELQGLLCRQNPRPARSLREGVVPTTSPPL